MRAAWWLCVRRIGSVRPDRVLWTDGTSRVDACRRQGTLRREGRPVRWRTELALLPGVDLSGFRRLSDQESVSIRDMGGGGWRRELRRLGAVQGCIRIWSDARPLAHQVSVRGLGSLWGRGMGEGMVIRAHAWASNAPWRSRSSHRCPPDGPITRAALKRISMFLVLSDGRHGA